MRTAAAKSLKDYYLRNEKWLIVLSMVLLFPPGFLFLDHYAASLTQNAGEINTLRLSLDERIPFMPDFVWAYLLYYPVCFLPALLIGPIRAFRRVALAYAFEFMVGFLAFAIFPIHMIRPAFAVVDPSTAVLRMIYNLDPGYNIFPSLHVANAFLVALIFFKLRNRREGATLTGVAVLIALSALAVKQHYVVDVAAGVVLAWVAYRIAFSARIWKSGFRVRLGSIRGMREE